jgi:hypothetical protein
MRATCYAGAIFLLFWVQSKYTSILERTQKSVFMLRMPNVSTVEANLYCDIPYDDCRCSIVSTKYCLTDKQLKTSRIVPLVLFVLQLYLIRELVSLSGDNICFLVYVPWIASLFVFIGILAIIYRYHCFYGYTGLIVSVTGYPLSIFVIYKVMSHNQRTLSSHNNNIIMNVQWSERIDNSVQYWQELLYLQTDYFSSMTGSWCNLFYRLPMLIEDGVYCFSCC